MKFLPLTGYTDVVKDSDNPSLETLDIRNSLDSCHSEIRVLPSFPHYTISFQKNAAEQINSTLFFCNSLVTVTESG